MAKLALRDIDISGKKVFIRVDFNVPRDDDGNITDDARIRAALPTVQYVIDKGAVAVLASHLGRPKGKVVDKYRMDAAAKRLGELLGKSVKKLDDCVGPDVEAAVDSAEPGDVIMLENLRFHPEEEANDAGFARQLSKLADVFINDAFGACHRAHASTAGIASFMPSAAGFLVEKELKFFTEALEDPRRPFTAILGGAKVSDKIPVIENLLTKVDSLIIGGAMAYTFLRAENISTGDSIVEQDRVELALELMEKARGLGVRILLPVDHVAGREFKEDTEVMTTESKEILPGWMGLDIGPKTIDLFLDELSRAKTVIWNGPPGVFEMDKFSAGTKKLAEFLSDSPALTILGGGDTAAAAKKFNLAKKFNHVSTGGGASLEFMEGKELPGITALGDR